MYDEGVVMVAVVEPLGLVGSSFPSARSSREADFAVARLSVNKINKIIKTHRKIH